MVSVCAPRLTGLREAVMNQNDCKILVGHDFNHTHKDCSAVVITMMTQNDVTVIKTIVGMNSECVFDLTSALRDIGYKVVRENIEALGV